MAELAALAFDGPEETVDSGDDEYVEEQDFGDIASGFFPAVADGGPAVIEWGRQALPTIAPVAEVFAGNLLTEAIKSAVEWLQEHVFKAGVEWLIGALGGPASGFVLACKRIISVVKTVMAHFSGIMDLVRSALAVVHDVAFGALNAAKDFFVKTLKKFVPLLATVFASVVGIGELAARIRGFITRLQTPVLKIVDSFLKPIAKFFRKHFRRLAGDKQEVKDLQTGTDHVGSITVSAPDLDKKSDRSEEQRATKKIAWTWKTATPPTSKQASDGLKSLRYQLTAAQDNILDKGFEKAQEWIASHTGDNAIETTDPEGHTFANDYLGAAFKSAKIVLVISKGKAFEKE